MEWRRVYPTLLLTLLGSSVLIGIILILIGEFFFPPLTVIGIVFIALPMGLGFGLIIDLLSKSNKTYKVKIYIDTKDLIELIGTCNERAGRTSTYKLKQRKVRVDFEHFEWFTYYPYRGYIEIPQFSMRDKKLPRLHSKKPQTIIEDLIGRKMKAGTMLKERKDLDLDRIYMEIKKIKAIEVQKQMGDDNSRYTDSPIDKYVNYSILFFCLFGLAIGIPIAWFFSDHLFATLFFGGLFGPLGGFMIWVIAILIVTVKFGNLSSPYKFRLRQTEMDIANKDLTKRWSFPYKQMKKVRRVNRSNILLIEIHESWRIKGGLETMFMDKMMIKMSDDQITEIEEKLKKARKFRSKSHRYTSLSNPSVTGENWEEGEKKVNENFKVGDDDVEEVKERVIYKLKP